MHTQQLVSQCQLTFSQPGEPQVLQSRSTTVELLSPLCWHLPGRVSLMLLSSLHRSLSTLGVSLSRALSTLGVSPQRSASCWCLCLFPSFTRSTTQYSLSILPLSHAPSVPSTLFPSLSFPLMLPLSRSLSCSLSLVPSHAPSLSFSLMLPLFLPLPHFLLSEQGQGQLSSPLSCCHPSLPQGSTTGQQVEHRTFLGQR